MDQAYSVNNCALRLHMANKTKLLVLLLSSSKTFGHKKKLSNNTLPKIFESTDDCQPTHLWPGSLQNIVLYRKELFIKIKICRKLYFTLSKISSARLCTSFESVVTDFARTDWVLYSSSKYIVRKKRIFQNSNSALDWLFFRFSIATIDFVATSQLWLFSVPSE